MSLSGIIVAVLPEQVGEVAARLAALPLTDVAQIDESRGRIVVVQERATVGEAFDALRTIQRLPHVLAADLAMHYFGDEDPPSPLAITDVAARLDAGTTAPRQAPDAATTEPLEHPSLRSTS